MSEAEPIQDQWTRWLLHRRHGGDPEVQKAMLDDLYRVRDKVLQNARVTAGDVFLDVGAGDGLIAFGALPLVGEQGRVIFSDISHDLLDHCRSLSEQMAVRDCCAFVQASADDLSAQEDGSVDVVTTRSVLIYVRAKQQAFREFYRVLKPGGRLSIYEPINRFRLSVPQPLLFGYDVTPVQARASKVAAVYGRLQPADTDPMLDFDERDLLTFAWDAGFRELRLELQKTVTSAKPRRWDVFARQSGNPNIPTPEEAIKEVLTPTEAEQLIRHLRSLVETGQGMQQVAEAYLWAVKHAG